jgi:heme exporter protein B
MTGLWVSLRRELALAWGGGGGPLLALTFYVALATLLPLSVGAEPARLAAVAPGCAWLALALSSLLSLERLFERDHEDGALDLLALGPAPLEAVAFCKCLAQWLTTGAPLALAAPIVSTALGAPLSLAPITLVAALAGGLGFSFCGGIGAALSLGGRRGGVLIAVIVLPLFAPPVVFGAGAIEAFGVGLDWRAGLALLGAYSLGMVALGPFAMAAACRNALS